MQNLSDNELDKRFQEAADGYRPPFDPGGWQELQQRLDNPGPEVQRNTLIKNILRSIPFILVFLAGSISGVMVLRHVEKSPISDKNGTQVNRSDSLAMSSPAPEITDDIHTGSTESTETESDPDQARASYREDNRLPKGRSIPRKVVQEPSTPPRSISSNRKSAIQREDNTPPEVRQPTQEASSYFRKNRDGSYEHPQETDSLTSVDRLSAGFTTGNVAVPDAMTANRNTNDGVHDKNSAPTLSDSTEAVADNTKSPVTKDLPGDTTSRDGIDQPALAYRLSVAAIFSPDFSSVNFSQQTRPGSNFGFIIEYHLTHRISIQGGAIMSTKLYKARDLEYHGYAVDGAEGDCRIIDIPLNLYYRSNTRNRYTFFAGAGLSSYLMKKENYTFFYDTPNGMISYDQRVRNKNNEWFKVANLSIGISRRLNERFYLEAEPFIKVPLSGVGEGKLDVSTFGMFLRARFSLFRTQ